MIYSLFQEKLEKFSKKLLQNFVKDIIIRNVKILQILVLGGINLKEKITVLIADDNPDFAMTLVNYLEKEDDMEVIGIAKDGKEACDMIINTRTRCSIVRCYNAIFRWTWCFRENKCIWYE